MFVYAYRFKYIHSESWVSGKFCSGFYFYSFHGEFQLHSNLKACSIFVGFKTMFKVMSNQQVVFAFHQNCVNSLKAISLGTRALVHFFVILCFFKLHEILDLILHFGIFPGILVILVLECLLFFLFGWCFNYYCGFCEWL